MKRNLLPILAVSAFLLNSCSTTQLARQTDSDDVYYTEAKAKVIVPVAKTKPVTIEQIYRTDEQLYGDTYNNRYDNDYYSYSSRINRFYYNSPYRPYYDYRYSGYNYNPWYTYSYDPFLYDPWSYRSGVSIWVGRSPRSYWGYDNYYYGYNNYNNGYWGPYSYYNTYPGYGYGNRYYGNSGSGAYSRPSTPRPNREAGMGRATIDNSGGVSIPTNGRPGRGASVPDRGTQSPGRISSDNPSAQPSSGSSRPSRTEERQSRPDPTPAYQPPPREYSRPERSSSPSYDTGGSSGSGSSSGGSSSGGGRPSRN